MIPSLAYQGSRCIVEATSRIANAHRHSIINSSNFLRLCSSSSHHSHHHESCRTNENDKQDKVHSSLFNVPAFQIVNHHLLISSQFKRGISVYSPLRQEENKNNEETATDPPENEEAEEKTSTTPGRGREREKEKVARHLNKDRSKAIPLETSMRYLKSAAYKEAYGDTPVWVPYRRNFPGQFAPKKTRKTCVRNDQLSTGNPCPICRDEYLVVDYRNVDLLKQFISPFNGEVLHWDKTGVCRKQHEQLLIAIDKAKDYGLITFDVPFREYDYKAYENIYASYK